MGAPMANGDGRQYQEHSAALFHFGGGHVPWLKVAGTAAGAAFTIVVAVLGFLASIGVFNAPVMKPEINEVKAQVKTLETAVSKIGTKIEEISAATNRIDGFISGQLAVIGSVPAPAAPSPVPNTSVSASVPSPAPVPTPRPIVRRRPVQKTGGWSIFN